MFDRLGRFTARWPWVVCGAWLVFRLGAAPLAPPWDARAKDDDVRFLPARCPSLRGYHLLERAFPQDVFASKLVFALEREGGALTDDDLGLVDEVVKDLNALRRDDPALQ